MPPRPIALVLLFAVYATSIRAEPAADWALAAVADCTRPDGGTFVTEVVSLPDGTTLFEQDHGERQSRMVVLGEDSVFTFDFEHEAWSAADPAMIAYVRGHDVHRMVLRAGQGTPGRLVQELPEALGGGSIAIEHDDPRPVIDVDLPHHVVFDHDGERWDYRFRSVLPFRVAPDVDVPETPDGVTARLRDLHAIVALHERALQAHRDSDVDALIADEAPQSVHSSRGRLWTARREDLRARLGPYLAATTFTRYADVVAPIVSVANDGTTGWLACEIDAAGRQTDADGNVEDVAFGFSWVEMVVREDDAWYRAGTASSARD